MGDHAINKIFTLGNTEFPVSWENEIKLWTFLETRAALLLKTYKTSSEVLEQCQTISDLFTQILQSIFKLFKHFNHIGNKGSIILICRIAALETFLIIGYTLF